MGGSKIRVALVAAIVSLTVAAAAAASSNVAKYNPGAVLRAFNSHGIKMYNAGVGTSSPVTTLASVKAHDGWRVGVYVYATLPSATRSYSSNLTGWKRSGFASTRQKNVIVVVVPVGRTRAKTSKAFAMPKLVSSAITAFEKK